MTAPSFTDSTLNIGNIIGRYFSIVSMLPALFLALWTYALIASGAWRKAPDLKSMTARTSHWSLTGVAWLIVATLLVALFLHPLQFAMTQLLEGYWGSSPVAIGAMKLRIVHYRRRQRQLIEQFNHHEDLLQQGLDQLVDDNRGEWSKKVRENDFLNTKPGDQLIVHIVNKEAVERQLKRYPDEGRRVMSTRLGNALRRFEDTAGSQYGLDAILTIPYFSMIAQDQHAQYLRDSRQQMDTSISLCTVSFLATIIAVVFLLTDGLWLLVSLVPYAFAYIAYRGAVAAADEYAAVVTTVIDLDRFQLYKSLRIDAPINAVDERKNNENLMKLLRGDKLVNVRYSRDSPRKTG